MQPPARGVSKPRTIKHVPDLLNCSGFEVNS
jgi:hypothetical protein